MKTTERVLTLPNVLSGMRVLAAPFLVWMVLSGNLLVAVALFGFGLITDYLDGYLARNYGWETSLGAEILDPGADKVLMLALFAPRLAVIPFEGWWWWTAWLFVPLLIAESILVFGGMFVYLISSERVGSNVYGKLKLGGEGLLGVLILVFPESVSNNKGLIVIITLLLAVVTFLALKSIMSYLKEWRKVCLN